VCSDLVIARLSPEINRTAGFSLGISAAFSGAGFGSGNAFQQCSAQLYTAECHHGEGSVHIHEQIGRFITMFFCPY
jgi:hypothetical protein